jgi:phosphohistidine phosphatase
MRVIRRVCDLSRVTLLVVVRHAPAGHYDPAVWPDDSARPLSEVGRKRFEAAACGLARLVPEVDALLSSGYVRSWQTAELLHEAGWPVPEELRALEVRVPPIAVAGALRGRSERSIAVVGHEPQLSELTSLLCAGDEETLALELKKGAAVALDGELAPGRMRLLWAVPPRVLRR